MTPAGRQRPRYVHWVPFRVCSGGQTGADQGWLAGAEAVRIPTGGWAPKGWWTERGANPGLLRRYGLQEHSERGYPPRTEANVRDSDGTIIVGDDGSSGSALTKKVCLAYRKPVLSIPYRTGAQLPWDTLLESAARVRRFVWDHGIRVLNGAGNREESNPGVYGFTLALAAASFHVPSILNLNLTPGVSPVGAVYVGRGSPWGNPFSHTHSQVPGTIQVRDREEAIHAFREWAWAPIRLPFRSRVVSSLSGRSLVCHCSPLECHAETLRDIAALGPGASATPGSLRPADEPPDPVE